MASTTALYIFFPLSLALLGVFAKFGFDMKRDNKPAQMWGYFFSSAVPFAVVTLIWGVQEGVDMATRNIVLGLVGGAVGAIGLIWAGYLLEGRSKAATPASTAQSAVAPPQAVQYSAEQRYYDELSGSMTEALADPRYSAETKLVISHKRDLLLFKQEYMKAHPGFSASQFKSKDPIEFFNRRLRETGKDWQITADNVDATFGNIMLDSTMGGAMNGIKIKGGGGNTFDQTDMNVLDTGIDLENTKNNSFSNTRINKPGAPPPRPENSIGSIVGNNGVVTQGQKGDNTR